MGGKTYAVRRAAGSELDDVAAFCAGKDADPRSREIRRRRRRWLEDGGAEGLVVLVAVDGSAPAELRFGDELVSRDELTLLHDGLAVAILEYLPIEKTLYPVSGEGYYFIDCLWVLPPYLGRGIGRGLVSHLVREARKDETGVAVVAWAGTQPFGSWTYMPPAFFRRFGFEIVDADGDRVLMVVRYGAKTTPVFSRGGDVDEKGYVYLCHPSCPASMMGAARLAENEDVALAAPRVVEIGGGEEAKKRGALFGVCRDGRVVINRLAFGADIASLSREGEDHNATD